MKKIWTKPEVEVVNINDAQYYNRNNAPDLGGKEKYNAS